MTGNKLLVIGLGNEFRGDDAFGIRVVEYLQSNGFNKADCLIEQSDLTRILELWGDRDVIVVDCLHLNGEGIGSIHEFDTIELLLDESLSSTHGVSLKQTYQLAETVNKRPRSLKIIAAVGRDWSMGNSMDEKLESVIPIVAEMVRKINDG